MRQLAIVAAIALVTLLAAPGSASAWEQAPCISGELVAGDARVDPSTSTVKIPGIVECGVKLPGAKFVVAVFEYGIRYGYYHSDLMTAYAAPEGPTKFTLNGKFDLSQMRDVGLCIMPDEKTRLSCVQFARDLLVVPLSTSDPKVAAAIIEANYDDDPNCGSCWWVP